MSDSAHPGMAHAAAPGGTASVFICIPSLGQIETGVLWAMLRDRRRGRGPRWLTTPTSSNLCLNFNSGWADALILRERGLVDYFLMLHADEVPQEDDWLERLIAEMARVQADVLSVIVPIKSARGLTSTARDTDRWRPVRYSMTEVLAMPETWTAPDLLVSSGPMLVDFRKPWVESVCFTVTNAIVRDGDRWVPLTETEDWHFSRQCRALGVRLFATRVIRVEHWGPHAFPNDHAWGQPVDVDNRLYAERKATEATEVLAHNPGVPEPSR